MDKFKLASSSLGERLKTGGSQMSRIVSSKVKEILQSPTLESKMVDEATLEHMEEPNWGLNMRICSMINSEEFDGAEVVKAIKKKLGSKSVVCQRLGLDLLEACASNCEKVFSEVASEKVLDEMVRMIDDPRSDYENRAKASQLIRAWGQSEDLKYLPVFHQTYLNLKTREPPVPAGDGNFPPVQYSLESLMNQPMPPPERYPIPDSSSQAADIPSFSNFYVSESTEQKKETLEVTRNSLDILSSILNSEAEPKPIKDDLTVTMLEKCKESLPAIQRIAESTTDDDIMLFEALNLHDELQQIISRCEEMEVASTAGGSEPQEKSSEIALTAAEKKSAETATTVGEEPKETPKSAEEALLPIEGVVGITDHPQEVENLSSSKEETEKLVTPKVSAETNANTRR